MSGAVETNEATEYDYYMTVEMDSHKSLENRKNKRRETCK